MDNNVTIQDIKVKGAKALQEKTKKSPEAFITVRGEKKFVVMTIPQYQHFRECELEAALQESQADMASGKIAAVSVEDHIKDVKHV